MTERPIFHPRPILERLAREGVDFVVIGGVGSTLQGGELPTYDLDIMYDRSKENLVRLARVLESLNVRIRGGGEDLKISMTANLLRNGDRFTFASDFGDFDCMATADGAAPYAEIKSRSDEQTIGDFHIHVAGLDDLIAMKQATNRRKDLLKLAELIELRKLVDEE